MTATETTTIHLARPTDRYPLWQVFGVYEGPDDRYTFALREFGEDHEAAARRYAARLVERHPGAALVIEGRTVVSTLTGMQADAYRRGDRAVVEAVDALARSLVPVLGPVALAEIGGTVVSVAG